MKQRIKQCYDLLFNKLKNLIAEISREKNLNLMIFTHIGLFQSKIFLSQIFINIWFKELIDHIQKIFVLQDVDDIDDFPWDFWHF